MGFRMAKIDPSKGGQGHNHENFELEYLENGTRLRESCDIVR